MNYCEECGREIGDEFVLCVDCQLEDELYDDDWDDWDED